MQIIDKYYKETEYLLYNYKMFEISILNMQQEINYLKKEDGSKGLTYDNTPTSPTHKISNSTEDIALSVTEQIDYLEHSIRRMQNKIERINKALECISEVERGIIKGKYIDNRQWFVIAFQVKYSERHCKRIRNEAIEKIAIGLFGERAIEKDVLNVSPNLTE